MLRGSQNFASIDQFPYGRTTRKLARLGIVSPSPIFPTTAYANPPTLSVAGPGGSSPISNVVTTACNGQVLVLPANAAAAAGQNVLVLTTNAYTNSRPLVNMVLSHIVATPAIPVGTTITAVTRTYPGSVSLTLSNNITGAGIGSGDQIGIGSVVVTFPGAIMGYKTQFSANYNYNNINASWTAPSYVAEFDYFGAECTMVFRAVTTAACFWLWLDGQPTTATPAQSTGLSAGSLYRYVMNFNNASDNTARWRRLQIYVYQADFGGIEYSPTDAILPIANPGPTVSILGDSWDEGANITVAQYNQTVFAYAMRNMGFNVPYFCGQGGTGYIATGGGGSKAAYTDKSRLNGFISTNPDIGCIFGSINDNGQSTNAVAAAAVTVFTTLQAALPTTKLIAFGVQPTPTALSTTSYYTVNNGIAAAARTVGIPFVDMMAAGILTGTGNSGSTTGVGNSDIMIYSDGAHPTIPSGVEMFGRFVASQLSLL